MARDKKADDVEFHSDFLDSHIDSGVGVIHLKDRVLEMGIGFPLASVLFDSLSIACDSEEIKVVFLTSHPSVLGEEKLDQFWERILALRDGTAKGFTERPTNVMAMTKKLLAQKVLRESSAGYAHHPQLVRFRNHSSPTRAIEADFKISTLGQDEGCKNCSDGG